MNYQQEYKEKTDKCLIKRRRSILDIFRSDPNKDACPRSCKHEIIFDEAMMITAILEDRADKRSDYAAQE